MANLTEAQRQALLTRAVEAVQQLRALGPDVGRAELDRVYEVASLAVTDAVTRGGHIHTLISGQAGTSGLSVIDLIADWPAQARALAVERNAAKNYQRLVREKSAEHARRRIGSQGYGARAAIAREFGVTPVTVDTWVSEGI